MRRLVLIVACALAASAVVGCRDDTVTLGFKPRAGATYDYRSTVRSATVTALTGEAPKSVRDRAVLRAEHRVLRVGRSGVQVRVVLEREGTGARTFVMRFDRAAQLTKVESVEGIPAEALGELGLSEIFPAAAGAPPDRPLAPGDRWEIDDLVQLPGSPEPTRLRGEGRLVELGVVDGHDVARVRSTVSLPLTSSTTGSDGTTTLTGVQTTQLRATYDLVDGALQRAESVTTGRFTLVLDPPAATGGTSVRGTLTVEVRSDTQRQ